MLAHAVVDGATNWWAPSYSPQTGLFYVNAQEGWSFWYSALDKDGKPEDHQGGSAVSLHESSVLIAIDPQTGKPRWRRDAGIGKSLWRARTGANVSSGPTTNQSHGRQYVSMAISNTVYTFAVPQ